VCNEFDNEESTQMARGINEDKMTHRKLIYLKFRSD